MLEVSPIGDRETGRVLLTGVGGRLGRRVARRLHRSHAVVGVDGRGANGLPRDIEVFPFDVRRNRFRDLFRQEQFSAVVHLGVAHDPRKSQSEHHAQNISGLSRLLDCVSQFGVKKLVLLSSANVYGPNPDNPQFLTEHTPLLGGARFGEIRALIESDMIAQGFFWRCPEIETVVLRPTHIVGQVRNAPSNYLRLPAIPTLMGFDPMVQLIHQEDVVRAIELALAPAVRGIFNLAGPPPMPLSRVIELRRRARLPVPFSLARGLLKQLFRLGASSFPAPELDFIRFVCMVDDRRAREQLGYAPLYDINQCLSSLDDETLR